MSGKDTLANSYSTDTTYSVCKVNVRWSQACPVPERSRHEALSAVCSLTIPVPLSVPSLFRPSQQQVRGGHVPDRRRSGRCHCAAFLHTEYRGVRQGSPFQLRPDRGHGTRLGCLTTSILCAVVGSSVVGSKLRACITGGSTTASMTWADFHYYSVQRGMQQIDALMHSRIANLFLCEVWPS